MNRKAKVLLSIIIAAVAASLVMMQPPRTAKQSFVGSVISDFELVGPENNRMRLSDLRGSVVFVNFWATWCASCIDELPSIERMYRQLSDNASFRVVTILYKDDLDRALKMMKQYGFTFPVYVNEDDSAARIFGITGVPETFLIDKRGTLRNKVIGPAEWDSPRALEIMHALLHES